MEHIAGREAGPRTEHIAGRGAGAPHGAYRRREAGPARSITPASKERGKALWDINLNAHCGAPGKYLVFVSDL